MSQHHFTKDGHTVTVSSARAAVQLRYDGWTESPATDAEPAEEPTPAKAAPKKTSK